MKGYMTQNKMLVYRQKQIQEISNFYIDIFDIRHAFLKIAFKYVALRVPNEAYSRNASCALNLISTFLL